MRSLLRRLCGGGGGGEKSPLRGFDIRHLEFKLFPVPEMDLEQMTFLEL